MATQTLSPSNNLLRRALQGDGLTTAAFGLLLTFGASPVASFMGVNNALPILALGLILAVYGAGLFVLASRETIDRRLPIIVIELNVAWVMGSAIVLAADLFGLTTGGRWGVLIVADLVALLTIAQFIGLRRDHQAASMGSRGS
jgi:hypothetical protein